MQFHLTASVLNFSHLNWCNQVLTFALPRQDWSRVLSIKRLHEEVYICSKDAYKCVLWVSVLRYHLCKTPAYLPVVCDKHRRTGQVGTDKKVAGIWQSSLAWTQKHGQADASNGSLLLEETTSLQAPRNQLCFTFFFFLYFLLGSECLKSKYVQRRRHHEVLAGYTDLENCF